MLPAGPRLDTHNRKSRALLWVSSIGHPQQRTHSSERVELCQCSVHSKKQSMKFNGKLIIKYKTSSKPANKYVDIPIRAQILASWCSNVLRHSLVLTLHNFNKPSAPTETSCKPLVMNFPAITDEVWPSSVYQIVISLMTFTQESFCLCKIH